MYIFFSTVMRYFEFPFIHVYFQNLQQDLGNGPCLSVFFGCCFFYLILIIWFSFLLCVISSNAGYIQQYLYMCLHAGALIISLFFWSSKFFISSPSGTLMNSSSQYTPLCQIVNYQNVWPSVLIKSPEESCLYTCERACSV